MKPVIRTYSGLQVNPLDVDIEHYPIDLLIIDIAHHLALINRFNGATRRPISVAQHSVYVCRIVQEFTSDLNLHFQALLHDAAEAFLGDVTKWLKQEMPEFCQTEDELQRRIWRRFGCPEEMHDDVEIADRIMVRFEGNHDHGFGPTFIIEHPKYGPLTPEEINAVGKWAAWSWREAEELFHVTFRELCQQRASVEAKLIV